MHSERGISRRDFMMMTGAAAAGTLMLSGFIQKALASHHMRAGIKKIEGKVQVNGGDVEEGLVLLPGDRITTDKGAKLVYVMGLDAFLVHGGSDITMQAQGKAKSGHTINAFKINSGKILSVFLPGNSRKIITPTAVAGVRGTGMYVETEGPTTYICLCYGEMELESTEYKGVREHFTTKHHEQPRYILSACSGSPILPAPMIGHTDDELYMLEALVDRTPPFEKEEENEHKGKGRY